MTKPTVAFVLALLFGPAPAHAAVKVTPPAVALESPEAAQQLLVSLDSGDGTRTAKYEAADPAIATVDATGRVTPKSEGKTEVVVRHGADVVRVPVEVKGLKSPRPVSFEQEVIPILTKATCNSGGCHGKAEGQGGLKLSVFGFDPQADFQALASEGRGRRVFPAAPENSLFLMKATGGAPHGGGKKLDKEGHHYRRLLRWVKEGTRFAEEKVPAVSALEVEPNQRTLALGATQQLRVTAIFSDGSRRCVTAEAGFDSNAGNIAGVDGRGLITAGDKPGEAAVLVRYMGQVAVCRITLPRPGVKFDRPAEANFIDKHV